MLVTIIAFFYITFCCWSYGIDILALARRHSPFTGEQPTQPFIITCFIGLAAIASLLTIVSLFSPIGILELQAALLIPLATTFYAKRVFCISLIKNKVKGIRDCPVPILAAALAGVLLVLVMHAWPINHPDTIAYHAQNILWLEKYRAVPGIANLQLTYGIQSSWFVLAAGFSFPAAFSHVLTYINAVVLIWFIIFIIQQLFYALKKPGNKGIANALVCLALLAFSFWSYTQVRLTATSASPDFIATLYTWLIIYLFIIHFKKNDPSLHYQLLFLSFFAVTVKLSALPCVLLSLYAWFRYSDKKVILKLIMPLVIGLFVLVPFGVRNVISSGYIAFPSAFPNWFTFDWKVPSAHVSTTGKYITAFARTNVPYNEAEISAVLKMKLSEWLPLWWRLRSVADKVILICIPALFLLLIPFYRKVINRRNEPLLVALIFSLLGIVFWFVQAPDPRFGFGFIISFIFLAAYLLIYKENRGIEIKKEVLSFGLILFAAAVLSYTGFRFVHYSNYHTLIIPSGVTPVPYKSILCGDSIHIPIPNVDCGATPLPCTRNDCTNFIPRGEHIQDGFQSTTQ